MPPRSSCLVDRLVDRGPGTPFGTEQRVGGEPEVGERQVRGLTIVDRAVRVAFDAGRQLSGSTSTTNSEMPSVSRCEPDVRAVTRRWLASGALLTTVLTSVDHPFVAVTTRCGGDVAVCITRGRLGGGECGDRRAGDDVRRSARARSPPARRSNPGPITTVSTNGSTTSAYPRASVTIMSSTGPPPSPPSASGKVAPRIPSSSAKLAQISGSPAFPGLHRGTAVSSPVPSGQELAEAVTK